MRRRNLKKQKKIIIISSLCLLLCLCVGYAAFNTQLSLRAKGNVKDNSVTIEDLKDLVVTEGDGLYQDEYESGRYFYKGANPNNYITFNNETWRILSVEADGRIKIVRDGLFSDRAFGGSNAWETSYIKEYLNGEYLESITTNQDKLVPSTWSIGAVTNDNNDLAGQIADENETQSQPASVGLITASEYLRVNTNEEQCGSFSLNNSNKDTCKTTNWLFKGDMYWTISSNVSTPYDVFYVDSNGPLNYDDVDSIAGAVLPAITLSSDISLSGNGSSSDPYIIV